MQRLGRYPEALRYAERSGELAFTANAVVLQSYCLRKLSRHDEALRRLDGAVERFPDVPELRLERALVMAGDSLRGREEIRRDVRAAERGGLRIPENLQRYLR